jgi:hypothetical protein
MDIFIHFSSPPIILFTSIKDTLQDWPWELCDGAGPNSLSSPPLVKTVKVKLTLENDSQVHT